jgi:HemY protein
MAFQDAMHLLSEGRFGQALKRAGEAHAVNHAPALAALLAARAAQRLGEAEKEKAWLERASRDDPRMEPARLMLEAEMHIDGRNFEGRLRRHYSVFRPCLAATSRRSASN